MKKIIAGIFAASAFFASASFAAPTVITSGNAIGNAQCELLAENVVLTLSNNVHGAYNCTKDNNSITVATCHFAGSRKVGEERCVQTGTDAQGAPTYNDPSCQGTTPTDTFTVDNKGKAFVGSATGGSIGATSLTAFCDDTSVVGALQ